MLANPAAFGYLYSIKNRRIEYVHPGVDFVGNELGGFFDEVVDATLLSVYNHTIFGRFFNSSNLLNTKSQSLFSHY